MSIEMAKKRAKKFFSYHKLSLPVDVKGILEQYALVEEVDFPFDVDGICVNGKGKPHIFIRDNMSINRKRFTFAHELGHIQIPNHIGMISCNTELSNEVEDYDEYRKMELEANAFAEELLMPGTWIDEIIEKKSTLGDVISNIQQEAKVSFMAAFYNIIKRLPGDWMFIIEDKVNKFQHIKFTNSCSWPLLLREDGSYDGLWIKANCKNQEELFDETMIVNAFEFKSILNEQQLDQIAGKFIEQRSVDNIIERIVKHNNISWAHLFKDLCKKIPQGFVIKVIGIEQKTYEYLKSTKTYINPQGMTDDEKDIWLEQNATYFCESQNRLMGVKIWYFKPLDSFYDNHDTRSSKLILSELIKSTINDRDKQIRVSAQINGVIGNLYGKKTMYTDLEFFNILKQKFYGREDLYYITDTLDFHQFLVNKTKELYSK